MNKKKISILVIISVILILLLGTIGITIFNLAKDFGTDNLNKSIIALYKVKSNENIDYVEINENEYLIRNKETRMSYTFDNHDAKENSEIEPATFNYYKDRACYSIVQVVTAKQG